MKAVRHIARIGVIAACASVTGCFNVSDVSEPAADFTSKGAAVLHPNFGCSLPPTLDPTDVNFLAGDITSPFVQQVDVDCFAWQSFIALNWPVDARWPGRAELAGEPDRSVQAKDWGTPQDPTNVALRAATWETYKPVQDIFVPPGETPNAWGVLSAPPSMCAGAPSRLKGQARTWRVLTFTSKLRSSRQTRSAVGANVGLRPDEVNQVVGGWLTDQNRNLVWYSRAVNRAEFEYLLSPDGVSADALYRQAGQRNVATDGNGRHPAGLSFPVGQRPQGAVQPWSQRGATEIKSAWRILTDLPGLWPRYHLAQAWLVDPDTKQCGFAILGLVGLHIVRSTATFPNFFWATFEHIDNAPQKGASYPDPYAHPFGYSFYDPHCTVDCTPNQPRIDKHGKPLFPRNQPVQVVRTFPITQGLTQLNLAVQQSIAQRNRRSVFQYYQLVNVQWDQSPVLPITSPNRHAPLNTSSMVSEGPNSPVANTTLETYVQERSCVSCHSAAMIAGSPTLASDFSFVFINTRQE